MLQVLVGLLLRDLLLGDERAELALGDLARFASPWSTNFWSTSFSTTGRSAAASVCAISPPIVPAPYRGFEYEHLSELLRTHRRARPIRRLGGGALKKAVQAYPFFALFPVAAGGCRCP